MRHQSSRPVRPIFRCSRSISEARVEGSVRTQKTFVWPVSQRHSMKLCCYEYRCDNWRCSEYSPRHVKSITFFLRCQLCPGRSCTQTVYRRVNGCQQIVFRHHGCIRAWLIFEATSRRDRPAPGCPAFVRQASSTSPVGCW